MDDHPVRLLVDDDLRRSRLTVFFRYLLTVPHIVWLYLWSAVVVLAMLVNWLALLITGKPISALHRFTSAYLRYRTHVGAFLFLVANPFPGFTGAVGTYPVELRLPGPAPQSRLKTFFRIFLAFPALLLAGILGYAMFLVTFLTWFVALFLGRAPRGYRDLGAFVTRYDAQLYAYLYLVTDRYPTASPLLDALPIEATPDPAPTAPVVPAVE
jgi:hypothetical protein